MAWRSSGSGRTGAASASHSAPCAKVCMAFKVLHRPHIPNIQTGQARGAVARYKGRDCIFGGWIQSRHMGDGPAEGQWVRRIGHTLQTFVHKIPSLITDCQR
jgi:hypothetical protein